VPANWILSLSLANLLVFPFWVKQWFLGVPFDAAYLLNRYHHTHYDIDEHGYLSHGAAIALVLVFAIVIHWLKLCHGKPGWRRSVFAGLTVLGGGITANAYRVLYFPSLGVEQTLHGPILGLGIAVLLMIGVGVSSWVLRRHLHTLCRIALLVLAPLIVVVAINGVAGIVKLMPVGGSPWVMDYSLRPIEVPQTDKGPQRRVLVVVFDAWDYQRTFERGDPSIDQSNINRLKNEATLLKAVPFHVDTLLAIPALVTGRRYNSADAAAGIDLLLGADVKDKHVRFSKLPTIFDDARKLGRNVALAGTGYHPMCHLFRHAVSACAGMGYWPERGAETLFSRIDDVVRSIAMQFPGAQRLHRRLASKLSVFARADQYLRTLEQLDRFIDDPALDLIYAHVMMPHGPYFYDRHKDRFTPVSLNPLRYDDALELVDQTVGRLVRRLKKSPGWQNTMLILTADHGIQNGHVPILVRWPGRILPKPPGQVIEPLGLRRLVGAYLSGTAIGDADFKALFPPTVAH